MKNNNPFRPLYLLVLAALIAPMWVFASDPPTDPPKLVVFGDSLSDSGNYYLATNQSVDAPYEPIPDAPYQFRDEYRFSNGRTWVEQLAGELEVGGSAKPALKNPGQFANYAFGRARAREAAVPFPLYDLGYQRHLFLTDTGTAPSDALYVIWIGTNDVRDSLGALQYDPSGALTYQIQAGALEAINTHVIELWQQGARNFLVLNVPDLSITPAISGLPAPIPAIAQGLSFSFNTNLSALLDGLEGALGVSIERLDVFTLLNTAVAAPEAFGLTNVTDPCLMFFTVEKPVCQRPNDFLFFDAAHPTVRGHRVVSRAVQDLLQSSP